MLHPLRIRLIGFILTCAGITIAFTPPGTFGITTHIQAVIGFSPFIFGSLMALGGLLILWAKPSLHPLINRYKLELYLFCTSPWLFYAISSAVFVFQNRLAGTVTVAYFGIYAFFFLESRELS